MKWFDKWFNKKCKQAWENSQNESEGTLSSSRPSPIRKNLTKEEGLHSRGVSFTLYNANGGTVVELRDYDPISDRNKNVLYVIPTDRDLGEQLGHIVTMEALKR